jgi:hypothetical protein
MGDDPDHLAIFGREYPPGLAVLEFGHHLIHGGIRRHHDLAAERDHVIPHPAGRPLVAGYLANLSQGQIRRDPYQVAGHHVLRLDPSQHLLDWSSV